MPHEYPTFELSHALPPRVSALVIDNHDSYTFNICHALKKCANTAQVLVVQNDDYPSFSKLTPNVDFHMVVIGPGPGSPSCPDDVKLSAEVLQLCQKSSIPVLGLCLGHQLIAHMHGNEVSNRYNTEPMHGRLCEVHHNGTLLIDHLFFSIPSPFNVVRYNSLLVHAQDSKLRDLTIEGLSERNEVMALKFNSITWGVQFHPESIASEYGHHIFTNFVRMAVTGLKDHNHFCQHARVPRPIKSCGTSIHHINKSVSNSNIENLLDVWTFDLSKLPGFSMEKFVSIFRQSLKVDTNSVEFWLDSELYGTKNNFINSRYSYYGNSLGRRSKIFHCCIDESSKISMLSRRQNNGVWEAETVVGGDYFEILETEQVKMGLSTYVRVENSSSLVRLSEWKDPVAPFVSGFIGFFGYKMRHITGFKKQNKIFKMDNLKPQVGANDHYVPDAFHLLADNVIIVDHMLNKLHVCCLEQDKSRSNDGYPFLDSVKDTLDSFNSRFVAKDNSKIRLDFLNEISDEEYIAQIVECKKQIKEGETYEVCLTKRIYASVVNKEPIDEFKLYLKLRTANPAPFSGFFKAHFCNDLLPRAKFALCCTSPERFIKFEKTDFGSRVEAKPIKGTIQRSSDPDIDAEQIRRLKNSVKDKSENLMIVDLLRNDIGMFADEVIVEKLFAIESFETVHQMVSTIVGYSYSAARFKSNECEEKEMQELETDGDEANRVSALEVIRACFPGGSMTGAPKKRTMEIIQGLEKSERGIYSGSFGFISLSGNCDANIVIRSLVITPECISAGTGGAITYLSCPKEELEETEVKLRALKSIF